MADSRFIETFVGIIARITPKSKYESQWDKEENFPLETVSSDVICDIIILIVKGERLED